MYDNTDDCDVLKSAAVQRKKLSDANEQLRAAQKQLKESSARIADLEEAVRVLAEETAAHRSPVPATWTEQEARRYDIKRRKKSVSANPLAIAAIEKARRT